MVAYPRESAVDRTRLTGRLIDVHAFAVDSVPVALHRAKASESSALR
jgi:hypothetical protein